MYLVFGILREIGTNLWREYFLIGWILFHQASKLASAAVVMTPEDAIGCFIDTKIDYLVFNNQVIVSKNSIKES